jgi:hypothetical protein
VAFAGRRSEGREARRICAVPVSEVQHAHVGEHALPPFFSLSVVFVVEKTPSFLTLGTGNGSGRQRGVWTWGRRCGCLHGVVSLYIYTYYTHTNTNARTHTYTYIYIFIFIHTHTQTQTHTHTHTHTHTNTHTHMPSPRVLGAQSLLYRLASPVHALTRIHGDWAVAAQDQ